MKRRTFAPPLALLVLLSVCSGIAAADCIDLDDSASLDALQRGQTRGFPRMTSVVAWRAGLATTALDHREATADVAWLDADGERRHQILLMNVAAGSVPVVSHDGPLLVIHLRYCNFEGPCQDSNIPYVWDSVAQRFVGMTSRGRQAIADARMCYNNQE